VIYEDEAFSKSSHGELSTSQLSSKYFEGWGYGEIVKDGFRLSYAIGDDYVRWTIMNLRGKHKGVELRNYLAEAAERVEKAKFEMSHSFHRQNDYIFSGIFLECYSYLELWQGTSLLRSYS
jgi:carnitine O-acetyltransferase